MTVKSMELTGGRRLSLGIYYTLVFALALYIAGAGMHQFITGTLINALLFITCSRFGLKYALVLGMATPLAAVAGGILPAPFLALLPAIALGNGLLSSVYSLLSGKNRALAVSAAASVKFLFLYGAALFLSAYPVKLALPTGVYPVVISETLARMMMAPQLLTALSGGLLAHAFLYILKKTGRE